MVHAPFSSECYPPVSGLFHSEDTFQIIWDVMMKAYHVDLSLRKYMGFDISAVLMY